MDDDIFDASGRIKTLNHHPQIKLTEKDYDLIRDYLLESTGIFLGETKKNMVHTRLSKHIARTGVKDVHEYLNLIKRSNYEWQSFVNALTTNLTSFFREPHHFTILTDHLKNHSNHAHINVWCAAASTGEEVWSIAITLMAAVEARLIRSFDIIASDIDTHVLEQARAGVYQKDSLQSLNDKQLRYLDPMMNGAYQIKSSLRDRVKFIQLNLVANTWPLSTTFDYIFCRNVMIYFERATQIFILGKMANYIRPKGLLFVGHSENFVQVQHHFKLLGRTVYERESP